MVCTCGACGVLACPACHGAGIPEAVAGHACAVGGGALAGRMISGGVGVHLWGLRGDCPAVAVMVRACRWRWQGVLAPGGWCTCGPYDLAAAWVVHLRGLRWIACPACHGDGVPEVVAGCACVGAVVHLRGV
ncbi:MAG: hypothetical protein ACI4PY_10365 [Akkermansia muciniphila]